MLPDRWPPPRLYADPPELAPLPEEEPLIAKSVAKRRNEFITVRLLRAAGARRNSELPPVPILKGEKGEPCWPDGVVGSLTHCEGFRGAVVGASDVRSVGASTPNRTTCCPRVCWTPSACPPNAPSCAALPDGLHWDRILFCAKEATYKAWFPLTHRWLGFEDAHITFDVDGTAPRAVFAVADPDRSRPPSTGRR